MALKVTLGRITEAEQRLGLELPPELKTRLLQENGGEVTAAGDDWDLHPVWDPTDRKSASRSANHIEAETRVARSWPGFPAEALSVATNASGDRLVVFPGASRIQSWDHETGALAPIEFE
jgi:hypothetical protein